MANIIEEGSLDRFISYQMNRQMKWKQFHCYKCGCEFNAHTKEYKYVWYKFGFYCICPTCASSVRESGDDWH